MKSSWFAVLALGTLACRPTNLSSNSARETIRLPTGQVLDPAGTVHEIGQMPLAMVPAPGGRRIVLLLNGYREQGVQVVDLGGRVTQNLPLEAAFIGLAFSADGRNLYASGGNQEVIYRYAWEGDSASYRDSLVLAPRQRGEDATHYPSGLALSPDGTRLYVAENLADSLAVVNLATGQVEQRFATGRYPYGVVVTPGGTVFVSNWGDNTLSLYTPREAGHLSIEPSLNVGRHPSALLLNPSGTRLFVASGSTDRIAVIDPVARKVIGQLLDPPPSGPGEGSTPIAMTLSADGTRLFVAEADANAVGVFALSPTTSGQPMASGDDRLAGRIPVGWYPTAVLAHHDTLYVANGKGKGTGPNPAGPNSAASRARKGVGPDRQYTLGQIAGSLSVLPIAGLSGVSLDRLTTRVARANGWTTSSAQRKHYPPFTHVVYVLKENRTYDQVLGDLTEGDGDTSLVLFGRGITPNQHALAQRFGVFDRFFVNAEVSADGHNWSMAAYATDYVQKTAPTNYSGDGRQYDFEGTNHDKVVEDDVAEPARGYLWDLAERAGISFRNFGEYVAEEGEGEARRYRGTKPFLALHTDSLYPFFDMNIPDQRRVDIWLKQFREWEADGSMPALQIVYLPRDHTAGARAGSHTPESMVADNDLALARVVEALSHSKYWENTVIFVVEDDAQDGPDHVDSHRSPFLAISAWSRPGLHRRFTNTTDVLSTIEEILGLEALSQFDHFGRPLRDIWADAADLTPYASLTPDQPLDDKNPARTNGAIQTERLDLSREDAADMDLFNRILWTAVRGSHVPYPGTHRMSALEAVRAR